MALGVFYFFSQILAAMMVVNVAAQSGQTAISFLSSPMAQLHITFQKFPSALNTQIVIETVILDDPTLPQLNVVKYQFHIHQFGISASEMNCSKTGKHFDPYGPIHANEYGNLTSFEVGDLTGKFNLTVTKDVTESTGLTKQYQVYHFLDNTLEWEGTNTFLGRSVVMHVSYKDQTKVFPYCAPIVLLEQKEVIKATPNTASSLKSVFEQSIFWASVAMFKVVFF
jgi:Cu/Zn superoxide dismutase